MLDQEETYQINTTTHKSQTHTWWTNMNLESSWILRGVEVKLLHEVGKPHSHRIYIFSSHWFYSLKSRIEPCIQWPHCGFSTTPAPSSDRGFCGCKWQLPESDDVLGQSKDALILLPPVQYQWWYGSTLGSFTNIVGLIKKEDRAFNEKLFWSDIDGYQNGKIILRMWTVLIRT